MFKTIEKVLLLQDIDIFSFASTRHLAELAQVCRGRTVQPAEVIFDRGDECQTLYLLVEGTVDLTDEQGSRRPARKQCLDLWDFFSEGRHAMRAEATDEGTLLEVTYEDVMDILTAEPELSIALLKYLARAGRALASGGQTDLEVSGRDNAGRRSSGASGRW